MAKRFEMHGSAVVRDAQNGEGYVVRISAAGDDPMCVLAQWAAQLCTSIEEAGTVDTPGPTTLALIEGEVKQWAS